MQCIEPRSSGRMLVNPGIGFFSAPGLERPDSPLLHEGAWQFAPGSRSYAHPDSGVSFVSARWRHLEPEEGRYDWTGLEEKLASCVSGGRVAVMRCAPYALGDDDIPQWLRTRNPQVPDFPFWQIDPNTSDYAACWARFVRAMAAHLDGHPALSSVDMALVGAWGEGGGTEFMEDGKLMPIVDAYVQGFKKTPLQCLLHDPKSLGYIRASGRPVGFRVDCLGDLGGFHGTRWSHMLDFYPQNIVNFGMEDAWQRAPVVFEACWTMQDWYQNNWDLDYIIEESLKWHISSFNSKGMPVPLAWRDKVEGWVRRMGYRLAPRRIVHEGTAAAGSKLRVQCLWLNSGAAPCYQPYRLVYRLRGPEGQVHHVPSPADIRLWMPGEDIWLEEEIPLAGIQAGDYGLFVGIETGLEHLGPLQLACEGCEEGFVPAGRVTVLEDASRGGHI